ncbi:MAG TPA: hypothetical protein VGV38_09635 [Pyrinomonadaceae bacterium]|nr:hypothetical protein [Pyrinomonadaceae bacterium]
MKAYPRRRALALLLLLLAAGAAHAQTYKPAVEYQSLMNLRFYEKDGGFLVEHLQLVFPPQGLQKAAFVITKAAGGEVARVPLRFAPMEFPAFGLLEPDGVPGVVRLGQSGDFHMSVVVDGQTVTTFPFSLKEETSADPFRPGRSFVREGPFRDLAYFSVVPDDPSAQVYFNWWMSLRELPAGAANKQVTLHLLAGGQEIAASRSPVVLSYNDWQFFSHKELSMPTQPRQRWLTLADLTKRDGELTLALKSGGQTIKSYKTRVAGGQIQRLPQNALGHQPAASFISPRFVDMSSGSSSNFKMLDMYWVRKSP